MLEITSVESEQRSAALDLLFCDQPAEDRRRQVEEMLREFATDRTGGEGLLGAFRRERLAGVVCSQTQPGRTAALWAPRLVDAEPAATADQLLEAALEQRKGTGVRLVQSLLPVAAGPDETRLLAGGFVHLADLLYLVSLEVEFPKADVSGPLIFEPCEDPASPRLADVVEGSYSGTLDCPLLDEARPIDEVLAGYSSCGVFHPGLWLIARWRGREVGCLILADHPRHGNLELVYMGVLPEFRGRGWGRQLTRKAQWLARRLNRRRLVLAVDSSNQPAIDAYASVGFQAWDRRRALVKFFQLEEL